jgi:hypothetical protein
MYTYIYICMHLTQGRGFAILVLFTFSALYFSIVVALYAPRLWFLSLLLIFTLLHLFIPSISIYVLFRPYLAAALRAHALLLHVFCSLSPRFAHRLCSCILLAYVLCLIEVRLRASRVTFRTCLAKVRFRTSCVAYTLVCLCIWVVEVWFHTSCVACASYARCASSHIESCFSFRRCTVLCTGLLFVSLHSLSTTSSVFHLVNLF